MREIWKSIPGWESMYEASNLGNVRSFARMVIRSNGRTFPVRAWNLKANLNSNGYRSVTLQSYDRGIKTTLPIYQMVMGAFRGATPPGLEILHGPKGKKNDSLSNLSFGTHQQNSLDMLRDGLPSAKPVIRSDGVTFPSTNRAAIYMKISRHSLLKAIYNQWKCGNYYWRFANEQAMVK